MFEALSSQVQSYKACKRFLGTRRHPARTCRDLRTFQNNVTNGELTVNNFKIEYVLVTTMLVKCELRKKFLVKHQISGNELSRDDQNPAWQALPV